MKTGIKINIDQTMYPKKLGISIPFSSAMALTIKLGAFPIYVFAPIKTAPHEIANNVFECVVINSIAFPPAALKKTKYVGALSKNDDKIPVNQKYIILFGLPSIFWVESTMTANAPSEPAFNIAIAGIMVIKIPTNNFATSSMGNHVNPFADRISVFVYFTLKQVKPKSATSLTIF